MARPRIALDETVIYNLALHGCSRTQIAAICGVHMDTVRDNYEAIVREGHLACAGTLLSKAMKIAHNEPTSPRARKKPYGEKVQAAMLMFLITKLANISPDVGKLITSQPGFNADDPNASDPDAMDDDAIDKRIGFIMGEVQRSGAPLQLPAGVSVIEGGVDTMPLKKKRGSPGGPRVTSFPKGKRRGQKLSTKLSTNVHVPVHVDKQVDIIVHEEVHEEEAAHV
jgi:hypothetical protein